MNLCVIRLGDSLNVVVLILLMFSNIVTKPGNNYFVVQILLAIILRVVLSRGKFLCLNKSAGC